MENRYKVTLDFKQRSILNINFVQNDIDTSVLELTIADNGQAVDVTGQDVTIAFFKADNTLVLQDVTSGVSILPSGNVECVLKSNSLACVGVVKSEISFSKDGKKLSTAQFVFNVIASLDNGEGIESTNELPKLDAKIADIQAQYNDDSTAWNSAVNNKIAEATNKITETETARQNAITAKTNADTATANTNAAIVLANQTAETTRLNWLAPVATFSALATTYPTAVKGDCAQVTGENKWYKYSGTAWEYRGDFSLTGYESIANVLSESAYQAIFRSKQMHSGCLNFPAVVAGSTTNLNSITIPAADYNINGNIISMPQTVVTLSAPGTTGTREDLVFFEAYFPTTNPYQLSGRYRTVSNVNFTSFSDGVNDTVNVKVWGGNVANTTLTYAKDIVDMGLYKSGLGDSTSKTTLQTYDGYSYAIPLFRVKRRNSLGYSPSNAGGSPNYYQLNCPNGVTVNLSTTFSLTLSDVSKIQLGNIVKITDSGYTTITKCTITAISGNMITFTPSWWANDSYKTNFTLYANNYIISYSSDHPQSLYSNVIDSRDITDLRHRTQVQYNYDYELKRASDQFMRGELSPKKMLTTHHGIPKSEIDGNTVFYASLDGTLIPEFGGSGAMNLGTGSFKPMPTGSGYKFNGDSNFTNAISVTGLSGDNGTIDFLLNAQDIRNETLSYPDIVSVLDSSNTIVFGVQYSKSTNTVYCFEKYTDNSTVSNANRYTIKPTDTFIKIRLGWDANNLYVITNGILLETKTRSASGLRKVPTKVCLGNGASASKSTISDVVVSNIYRGIIDYQLPPDFISGDAIIMPAYTNQRRILSQAQMTQTNNGIVKVGTTGSSRGLVTSRASGNWTSADTITVTGMAGEYISGVIDTDTALARVVQQYGTATVKFDDISKLSVGDKIKFWRLSDGVFTDPYTVQSLDPTNATAVFDYPLSWTGVVYAIEITASSSVPTVTFNATGTAQAGSTSTTIKLASEASATDSYYNNLTVSIISGTGVGQSRTITGYVGSTKVATVSSWTTTPDATSVYMIARVPVAGDASTPWTGLGTNVATFKLGAISNNLTNQDIQIDYSLIMPTGQSALTVPTTTTLMGEAGIRVPQSMSTITTDLNNKKSGRTWENANIVCAGSAIVANNPAPSTFTAELDDTNYPKLYTQDGTSYTYSTSVNGEQACVVLKFDVIKDVERKLGCKIPAKDTAGKVAWLKSNLSGIYPKWYGYGSGPTGNKATVTIWDKTVWDSDTAWSTVKTTTNSTVTFLAPYVVGSGLPDRIDSSGFVHVLAYADPSDGVTPSAINTDYISLDITFSDKIVNSFRLVNGTLAVRDDFKGKVAGSVVECPNIGKHNYNGGQTALINPSSFSIENNAYNLFNSLDGTLSAVITSVNGSIAQQLLSYNLIRIYEDKYGPIPAIDKVQWLKDNLASITCNWWGYGSTTTYKSYLAGWLAGNGTPTWSNIQSHVNGTVTKLNNSLTVTHTDSNGFVHYLAYADPSDGVTASTIYTDYCNIELTLKTSAFTGYDILSPENPRRDAGMSSILFVRKETKEVQPFLGHDTPLNLASYSEYLPAPDPISANTDVTILAEIPEFLVTDLGSAVGYKQGTHHWMNPAYRVGQDNDNLYGEIGFSSVPFAPDSVGVNLGSKINVGANGFNSGFTTPISLLIINKPTVHIGRWLCLVNGEIKLLILSRYLTSSSASWGGTMFLLSIYGKPLSKELEGLVRSALTAPTAWRTNPLVVEGFVDKATNKLITTGNSI